MEERLYYSLCVYRSQPGLYVCYFYIQMTWVTNLWIREQSKNRELKNKGTTLGL